MASGTVRRKQDVMAKLAAKRAKREAAETKAAKSVSTKGTKMATKKTKTAGRKGKSVEGFLAKFPKFPVAILKKDWKVGDAVYAAGNGPVVIKGIDPARGWVQVQWATPEGVALPAGASMLLMRESLGDLKGDPDALCEIPFCMPEPIEAHRLAEMLPPMDDLEYAALRNDIAANGQQEPIVLYQGKVLDGRHRQKALFDLGILPKYLDLPEGTDPLRYVYSKALHRNLDQSQKACAAALIKGEFEAEAKARMKAGKKSGDPKASVPQGQEGAARDIAGDLFGVSGRYVQEAIAVLNTDRKLFDTVFNGSKKLTHAAREIKEVKDKCGKPSGSTHVPPGGFLDWEIRPVPCCEMLDSLPRHSVNLIIAHPPSDLSRGYDYGIGDKRLSRQERAEVNRAWVTECAEAMAVGGAMVVIIDHQEAGPVEDAMAAAGLDVRGWATWQGLKTAVGNAQSNVFHRTSLRVLYAVNPGEDPAFNLYELGKLASDVWTVPALQRGHAEFIGSDGTQLPLALVRPMVLGMSNPGDLVVCPFVGTGTEAVAAVLAGRRFIGAEIDPVKAKDAASRVRSGIELAQAMDAAAKKKAS